MANPNYKKSVYKYLDDGHRDCKKIAKLIGCKVDCVKRHRNRWRLKNNLPKNYFQVQHKNETPRKKRLTAHDNEAYKIIKQNQMNYYKNNNITQVQCYLSGKMIHLATEGYQWDHIIPLSKNGANDERNVRLTTPKLNNMKGDLSTDEFFALCKQILEFNGYEVNKK